MAALVRERKKRQQQWSQVRTSCPGLGLGISAVAYQGHTQSWCISARAAPDVLRPSAISIPVYINKLPPPRLARRQFVELYCRLAKKSRAVEKLETADGLRDYVISGILTPTIDTVLSHSTPRCAEIQPMSQQAAAASRKMVHINTRAPPVACLRRSTRAVRILLLLLCSV